MVAQLVLAGRVVARTEALVATGALELLIKFLESKEFMRVVVAVVGNTIGALQASVVVLVDGMVLEVQQDLPILEVVVAVVAE